MSLDLIPSDLLSSVRVHLSVWPIRWAVTGPVVSGRSAGQHLCFHCWFAGTDKHAVVTHYTEVHPLERVWPAPEHRLVISIQPGNEWQGKENASCRIVNSAADVTKSFLTPWQCVWCLAEAVRTKPGSTWYSWSFGVYRMARMSGCDKAIVTEKE